MAVDVMQDVGLHKSANSLLLNAGLLEWRRIQYGLVSFMVKYAYMTIGG